MGQRATEDSRDELRRRADLDSMRVFQTSPGTGGGGGDDDPPPPPPPPPGGGSGKK